MNDYERGWVEAFIDSEGCFTFYKNRNSSRRGFAWAPSVQVGSTDRIILEKFISILGEGKINQYKHNATNKLLKKNFFSVTLSAGKLRRLLPKITLCVKERQRVFMLEALHLLGGIGKHNGGKNDTRLEEIWAEIRELNSGKGNFKLGPQTRGMAKLKPMFLPFSFEQASKAQSGDSS